MTVAGQVQALDISVFGGIPSQTTDGDRRSLLGLHAAARQVHRSFTWLEIGSHLGGSLQALVRDPACEQIFSIDPRPLEQPDERGRSYRYEANSTAKMLELLGALDGADVAKIVTLEASTDELDPAAIAPAPAVCFVDGEHTDAATRRDADFCRAVLNDRGVIAFHDSWIVHRAIRGFIDDLAAEGVAHKPYLLPDSIVAVELGELQLRGTAQVTELVMDGYWAYLWSMEATERWRDVLRRPAARALQRFGLLRVDDEED